MIDELGINDRFEMLCGKRDLKDNEIGELLGVTGTTIKNWRRGSSPINSIVYLDAICEEFGCTLDWLVYGKSEAQKQANRKARKEVKIFLERIAEEVLKLNGRLK